MSSQDCPYGIFGIACGAAYLWRVPYKVAASCALIGTSNFFELAVAVLVEVPVMLSLVAFANRTQGRFPRSEGAEAHGGIEADGCKRP